MTNQPKKSTIFKVRKALVDLIGENGVSKSEGLGRLVITTSKEIKVPGYSQFSISALGSSTVHPYLKKIIAESRLTCKRARASIGDIGDCAIVRHEDGGDRWMMILQDGTELGKWRTQSFDNRGFSGHMSFDSMDLAIEDAVKSHYSVRDDEALDRIQDSPEFQRGLYTTDLIGRVNSGKVSHLEADRLLEVYDESLKALHLIHEVGAQAFIVKGGQTMYLLADRIDEGKEQAVALHELMHRYGKSVLGKRGWNGINEALNSWSARPSGSLERIIHDRAKSRAIAASGGSDILFDEEFFAYGVEEAVSLGVKPNAQALPASAENWLAVVVSTLREVATNLIEGIALDLDAIQLVDLAYAMAQIESPERMAQVLQLLSAREKNVLQDFFAQQITSSITQQVENNASVEIPLFSLELTSAVAEYGSSDDVNLMAAQAQCAAVVSSNIGTDKWLKAPNGMSTKLTQSQWVLVRTENFKRWFGDWEADPENSSKAMDEITGEPKVVYHGTLKGGFSEFRPELRRNGHEQSLYFTSDRDVARTYSGSNDDVQITVDERDEDGYSLESEPGIYGVFLNCRNPNQSFFEGANWDGTREGQWTVLDEDDVPISDENGRMYFSFLEKEFAQNLAEMTPGSRISKADSSFDTTNSVVRDAKEYENDGAIIYDVSDEGHFGYGGEISNVYAVFSGKQVKSATNNTGVFDAQNWDIRYSIADKNATEMSTIQSPLHDAIEMTQIGKLDLEREDQAAVYKLDKDTDPELAFKSIRRVFSIDAELRELEKKWIEQMPAASDDYRCEHQAPMRDSGASLSNLQGVYPDDFYGPDGVRLYGVGDGTDARALSLVRSLRNIKNARIKVFRAIPEDLNIKISKGDWVSIERSYAKEHGKNNLNDQFKIISKTVFARDLFTNGDSIQEWGYDPIELKKDKSSAINVNEILRNYFFASKIIDTKGNPRVVYRGSEEEGLSAFNGAHYFAATIDGASVYKPKNGGYITEVYLNIKNPLDLTSVTFDDEFNLDQVSKLLDINAEYLTSPEFGASAHLWEYFKDEDVCQILKTNGYDGVISNEDGNEIFLAFDESQIHVISSTCDKTFELPKNGIS